MKLTRSWLEDYIDIPGSTEDLCHQLTMAGLEVDDISKIDNDDLIDIDLTPNRSDCLSVYGVARELNSINKLYKSKPTKKNKKIESSCKNIKINFNISQKEICPRYGYMYLKNISSLLEVPENIKKRLENIGIKSIHPIVDILNYLMIDIGQPLHAYDADKIEGDITVRFAKKNEYIKALDGNEYKLTEKNIVVSDSKEIISLAGIIGSDHCSVNSETKNIIIESAFFDPKFIANKARELKMQTESSHRFERGVDFNLPEEALSQLRTIFKDNEICECSDINIISYANLLPESKEVELKFEKISSLIGIDISDSEIINLLTSIGCEYNKKNNTIKNPSYRFDLNIHADYVEEIARVYGYDNIPIVPEKISIQPSKKYQTFEIINEIKQYLYKNSYSECINYSFVNDSTLENYNWKNQEFFDHYKISNYMSVEQNKLRSNLTSSLIKNIQYNNNVNSENSYRFFEVSNVFGDNIDQVLTCVTFGDRYEENWSLKNRKFDKYDMTTIVEDIAKIFGLQKDELDYVIKDTSSNKMKFIELTLSISNLLSKVTKIPKEKFVSYSKFPYIRRDLSFLIDVTITYGSILKLIEKINVLSLKKILLFDLYVGKNIPADKKSLGMGFIFQDEAKTLTHDQADAYVREILEELRSAFKIELRK